MYLFWSDRKKVILQIVEWFVPKSAECRFLNKLYVKSSSSSSVSVSVSLSVCPTPVFFGARVLTEILHKANEIDLGRLA
jgi:hypothetical protein